jgi:hypothetical protein
MTLIIYSCIVSRLGFTARHHAFFLNASIYDVTSFSPSIDSFLMTCTCINDILCLHVFLYKLFLYSVQYSIVINGLPVIFVVTHGVLICPLGRKRQMDGDLIKSNYENYAL